MSLLTPRYFQILNFTPTVPGKHLVSIMLTSPRHEEIDSGPSPRVGVRLHAQCGETSRGTDLVFGSAAAGVGTETHPFGPCTIMATPSTTGLWGAALLVDLTGESVVVLTVALDEGLGMDDIGVELAITPDGHPHREFQATRIFEKPAGESEGRTMYGAAFAAGATMLGRSTDGKVWEIARAKVDGERIEVEVEAADAKEAWEYMHDTFLGAVIEDAAFDEKVDPSRIPSPTMRRAAIEYLKRIGKWKEPSPATGFGGLLGRLFGQR